MLGKRIDALWYEYLYTPSRRPELEATLHVLAQRYLGRDFSAKPILLPPPPADIAAGEYPLGTVCYGAGECFPFGLREHELFKHVIVSGVSGSGKTNVSYLLVKRLLERGKPFLIFDFKRNYRDILQWPEAADVQVYTLGRALRRFPLNPLVPPPGTPPAEWLHRLIEVIAHSYTLGDGATFLLRRAIDAAYRKAGVYEGPPSSFPTFVHVLDWLTTHTTGLKWRGSQWMESVLRTVDSLCHGELGETFNATTPPPLEELFHQQVILEMDALDDKVKGLIVKTLILYRRDCLVREARREAFKHAFLVEEANNVWSDKTASVLMDRTIREVREYGQAIVLLDQHPSLISKPALGNANTTIALALKHNDDVYEMAQALLLKPDERAYLGELPVGAAIVKIQDRWPQPFLVRFPSAGLRKGAISDDDLRRRYGGDVAPNRQLSPLQPSTEHGPPLPPPEEEAAPHTAAPHHDHALPLMVDIAIFPTSGIADRLQRLRLSTRTANAIIGDLVACGFVGAAHVVVPRGKLRYLWVTERGREFLKENGHDRAVAPHGGPDHDYWMHRLAEHFRGIGYEVTRTVTLPNGHVVDLLAAKPGDRVLIEVETGKSSVAANLQGCLGVPDARVIQFAMTTESAAELRRVVPPQSVNRVTVWCPHDLKGSTSASQQSSQTAYDVDSPKQERYGKHDPDKNGEWPQADEMI